MSSSTLTYLPLKCVTPLLSTRYDRVTSLATTMKPQLPYGVGKHDLDRHMHGLEELPADWAQYIHLDGKPYFRHETWRVVTEAYVRKPEIRRQIEKCYHQVDAARSRKLYPPEMSDKQELYLTLEPAGYYFVDHEKLSVFWLDDVPLEQLGRNDFSDTSFETFIERNYYRHLENFPIHNMLPVGAEEFLRGALIHACTDHMTSRDSSTVPWNAEDCKTFLDLLDGFQNLTTTGYKTWFVSRLLCNILLNRWVHHYGMYGARTDRLASFSEPHVERRLTLLIDIISGALFFSAHHTYVDRLERVWADRIVSLDDWQRLLNSLLLEWSDSNLLATVTLSANMAFLALNNIKDAERVASITSALFAIGSIIVGLHHVWRHRVKIHTDAQQAGAYFRNATNIVGSVKLLAVFLSLPLILLSWSLVTFTVSVTIYAFHITQLWKSYVVMGVVLLVVLLVISATVLFFWGIFSAQGGLAQLQSAWHKFPNSSAYSRRHRIKQQS